MTGGGKSSDGGGGEEEEEKKKNKVVVGRVSEELENLWPGFSTRRSHGGVFFQLKSQS